MEEESSTSTVLFVSARKKKGSNITAEDLESFHIAEFVNLYVPPIILVAGTICNILSIIVMRSRHFHNISTSVYMIACAANDAVSLSVSLTPHWLYVNFPDAIVRTDSSHIMCKFFNFYGWGNCDYTIILTAAMTADRATVIMYPMKAAILNLVRRAKITVFVLILVVVAKEFHFLLSSDIVPRTRRDRMCDIKFITPSYQHFYEYIWPWIHIVFLTCCFLCIIISNGIIVWNVRKSDEMTNFTSSTDRERSNSDSSWNISTTRHRLRQVTSMLLAQSTTLILLTYPFSMHLAISSQIPDLYTDPVKKAANQLGFSIVFYLLYSNKCVNFVIYCISGSRFRVALKEVICNRRASRQSMTFMIKPIYTVPENNNTGEDPQGLDRSQRNVPNG